MQICNLPHILNKHGFLQTVQLGLSDEATMKWREKLLAATFFILLY